MGFFSKWEGINPESAVTGGIGGIFGLIGQNARMRKQHQNQLALMNQQYSNQRQLNLQGHQLQMDMWNKTNYPAQMEMMKEAGLNPALLYGMSGGGGTTTGSQGGGSASGGQAGMLDIGSALAAAKLGAEIKNINAQTDLTEKKGMTEEQNTLLAKAETEVKNATAKNFGVVYNNLLQEGIKLGLDNEFLQETMLPRIQKIGIENELMKANTKLSEEQVTKITTELQQAWRSLELKEGEVSIKAFEAEIKATYPSIFNVLGKEVDGALEGFYSIFNIKRFRRSVDVEPK